MGFIHAEVTNETDGGYQLDEVPIQESNAPEDDASNTNSSSNQTRPTTKSFSDLNDEINALKPNSVLVLKGKYKYNLDTDQKYKNGIQISKNIKIVGKGDCVIDAGGKARCFYINSKCKVTLTGITLKNGYSKGNGGAIYVSSHSKLNINKCVFKGNVAYNANGGAIAADIKTVLKVHDSKFYSNKAIRVSSKPWPSGKKGMGGAIKVGMGSTFTIRNSLFKNNEGYLSIIIVLSHQDSKTMTSRVYVNGASFIKNKANFNGVFYLDEYGKGNFYKSTFKYNVAKDKGATLVLDASRHVLVKDCKFIKNTGVFGGAIDLYRYDGSISHVSVVNCVFLKNHAKKVGGAIFSDYGELKIKKSKFISNSAGVSGGAVEVRGGSLKMIKAYFKKNRAKCGGAVLVKNKKSIYSHKSKFVKNRATVNGKNILGIYNHCVSKVKIVH